MSLFLLLAVGVSLGLLARSVVVYRQGRPAAAVGWLMGAALGLRLSLIGLDPFLHEWDERYHALVAKNLLMNPWRPVLRANPVLNYDYRAWCCNHVWLHKQPLFLWQMALSLKLFGVNEVAARLPSAVLGSLLLWPVYRIGRLIFSAQVGYYAALLLAGAYYQLELTTGFLSVDHSDVSFMAYVTGSIWAYYESRRPGASAGGWGALVGLLSGAAILCKWLPGLVVYAGWGLDILGQATRRQQPREYGRLLAALLLTLLVVLPWQVYTHQQFPQESAFEQLYAAQHFSQVLEGQQQPWHFYLLRNMWIQYRWLVVPLAAALVLLAGQPTFRRRALLPLLGCCGAIFGFFSLAATKMPAYTYVVAPLLLILVAAAWAEGVQWLRQQPRQWRRLAAVGMSAWVLLNTLRPWSLLRCHTDAVATPAYRQERERKRQHTLVYRQLDALVPAGYVVFNAPHLEDVEAMFYSHRTVYSGWPSEPQYQQLRRAGLRIAAFAGPRQLPPGYMQTPEVLLVPVALD